MTKKQEQAQEQKKQLQADYVDHVMETYDTIEDLETKQVAQKRTQILIDIHKETNKAYEKHGKLSSIHEAYAVLLEEVDEFWDEVKKKASKRNKKNMKKELVQIAAMCLKTIESFDL